MTLLASPALAQRVGELPLSGAAPGQVQPGPEAAQPPTSPPREAEAPSSLAHVPARPATAAEAAVPEAARPAQPAPETPAPAGAAPAEPDPSTLSPRFLTVGLAGTSTWRSFCAAPGVGACAAYAGLPPEQRAAGRAIDFTTAIPYTGGSIQLELFPLVGLGDPILKGLGLLTDFGFGASSVTVRYQSDTGETVDGGLSTSAERRLSLLATYRHVFAFHGPQATLPASVGLRAGYLSRHFLVAQELRAQLPSSRRGPLAAGIDVSVPLAKLVRLEASGLYLLLPYPGTEMAALFGSQVQSWGFGLELGVAGDIAGPLGYQLRFRLLSFHDRFSGAGSDWAGGGVVDEVYSGLTWGLTLAL